MFREDAFSWQGTVFGDDLVLVRCEKDDTRRITDLNVSTLSNKQLTQLLAEFFYASDCLCLPERGELLLPNPVGGLALAEVQKAIAAALESVGAIEVKFASPIDRDALKSTSVALYNG